ncbi:MAG: hypothetical protein KKA32_03715 [Actinobacteria bacterium]|nr:hypothetical protein [Actinomycetota bacterium]
MGRVKKIGSKELGLGLVLVFLLAFMMAGTALAATPQEIYDDYAADGRLDGDYTRAEIDAVFSDPVLAQYGDPDILDRLKSYVNASDSDRSVFPFTGSQMLMIFGGGVVLVGLGVLLRRGRREES